MANEEFDLDVWTAQGTQLLDWRGGDAGADYSQPTYEELPDYYMGEEGIPKFTEEGGYSSEYEDLATEYYKQNWENLGAEYGFDPELTDKYLVPGSDIQGDEQWLYKKAFQDDPNARTKFFERQLTEHKEGGGEEFRSWSYSMDRELEKLGIDLDKMPGDIFGMYNKYQTDVVPTFADELSGDYRWNRESRTGWIHKYAKDEIDLIMNPPVEQNIIDELKTIDEVGF